MAVRVLVVDDSRFFRRRVYEMLEQDPDIEVIGDAENGVDAIEKTNELKPDVITMDIEMPLMDGITATRKILADKFVPVLMFSSLTKEGAQATFDALDAGAVDYLPKRFEEFANNKDDARKKLCEKIKDVSKVKHGLRRAKPLESTYRGQVHPTRLMKRTLNRADRTAAAPSNRPPQIKISNFRLLAIGTSTGGPVALQSILAKLPEDYPLPILLIQHMPESFTGPFAQRLDKICKISVKEAEDGDEIIPGRALLAPGGHQMEVLKGKGNHNTVKVYPALPEQNYRPCVDLTFNSIAKELSGNALAIVLTGMGNDGCQGSQMLKKMGASIWVQDEETSVVYGMPASVIESGAADHVYSIDEIGNYLVDRL